MISVSGVFRNALTHRKPIPRNTGIGETRNPARITPRMNEAIADVTVSLRTHMKPSTYADISAGSERMSISPPPRIARS